MRSDEDVVVFLKSVNENFNSPKYDKFELRSTETFGREQSCDGVADKWEVKNWEKADFNEDGRTDLLVILYWYNYGVYAVIDKGDGHFSFLSLSFNIYDPCKLAKPLKAGGRQLLLYYGEKNALDKTAQNSKPINEPIR